MKINYLFGIFLLFCCTISLVGCQKEEWDIGKEETESSTVMEGTLLTSNGMPLANVGIKVDYSESVWLQYSKTRHKAEVKTDKDGKYRLHFQIKDDELDSEKEENSGVTKNYYVTFDLKNLNPKEYILPGDLIATITSVYPPVAEPTEGVEPEIRYGFSFERSKTYTENLYIPQKRYIQVTLKGFVPQEQGGSFDYFTVYPSFPYGYESADYVFPGTNYHCGEMNDYLFALYSAEEKTYDVPFALNENNIITLGRRKNGIYSTEKQQLFVTKDSPKSLIFEY